jgi:hypothetical protein
MLQHQDTFRSDGMLMIYSMNEFESTSSLIKSIDQLRQIAYDLFLSISDLSQLINTSLLTSGSETLSYADNCFIFYSVFRFIKRSKRFLIV